MAAMLCISVLIIIYLLGSRDNLKWRVRSEQAKKIFDLETEVSHWKSQCAWVERTRKWPVPRKEDYTVVNANEFFEECDRLKKLKEEQKN